MRLTSLAFFARQVPLVAAALPKASLAAMALVGLTACSYGLFIQTGSTALGSLTAGLALILLACLAWGVKTAARWLDTREKQRLTEILGSVASAYILTDTEDGNIDWFNDTAAAEFNIMPPQDISALFTGLHAHPAGFVTRMHDMAMATGRAQHHTPLQDCIRTYSVAAFDNGTYLWRIDHIEQTPQSPNLSFEFAQFSADGKLDYISPSMRETLTKTPASIDQLFGGAPPKPGEFANVKFGNHQTHHQALRINSHDELTQTVLLLPSSFTQAKPESRATQDHVHTLQKLPVGLGHIDIHGQLTYVNDEAQRLLSLRDRHLPVLSDILECLGRPVSEWIADIASGRIARSTEVLRLKHHFSETYLKVTLTAPPTETGACIVVVFSDVTELKSLEAKFTQSQKMQAIGQLAGGVAHDFNNLLTAISGHCDLLLLRHDRSDLNFPDLMQIQQNTNRAAALVRQLLALSRQQTLKFVTLDLHETMEDVIHLLNRLVGEKVTLTLRHGAHVAPIRSDKRQFEQILMNLVVNARDALPMGGEIRIETETRALPQGLRRENVRIPPGNYTLIKISDDGVGIPQALIGKVFEPFFTTKRQGEGTGLGLSTVYGIVKQSGGYIFIDSEEGVGACFTLYFAAQEPAPKAVCKVKKEEVHSHMLANGDALILLVEDETPVRSFAARALELQGHKVIEADCGEVALNILLDPSVRPDCFVTDVIMPGLDGPSWIAQIRDRFPETPVIFMSGYAEDSRVAAQARISNTTFLGKPFSLAELTQTVNAQLRAPTKAA